MTKTMTVICPKCHRENYVTPPSTGGCRIECRQCQHRFTIVSKTAARKSVSFAKQEVSINNSSSTNSSTHAAEVMDMLSSVLSMNQNASANRQHMPSPAQASNSVRSTTQISAEKSPPNLNTLLKPSSHQFEKRTPNVAEAVNTNDPQEQLINNESLQTSSVVNNPNTPVPLPEAGATNIEMNGNIGNLNNLVFTLLPGETQRQADVPLLLNDTIEKTDAIHAKTEYLHHQQDKLSKEFNWTLASIVALTILIMQLFYLMSVR